MLTRNVLLQKACTSTTKCPLRLVPLARCNSTVAPSAGMTSSSALSTMCEGHNLACVHTSRPQTQKKQKDLALGLRSSRPPDSVNLGQPPKKDPDEPVEVPDAEWEIRTGAPALNTPKPERHTNVKLWLRKGIFRVTGNTPRLLQNWPHN